MTENKQLELENKRLKEIIQDKIGTILKQKRKIRELEEENKRLKQGKYVYMIHGGSNDRK